MVLAIVLLAPYIALAPLYNRISIDLGFGFFSFGFSLALRSFDLTLSFGEGRGEVLFHYPHHFLLPISARQLQQISPRYYILHSHRIITPV